MSKLIMCLGLPGSGKSTWALKEVEDSGWTTVRVNKDSIREDLALRGWVWSREGEALVIKERNRYIEEELALGHTVISDDTNLAPKHQNGLKALAIKHHATFEVKDFRDVDINLCIERDAARTGKACVGRDVIVKMATTYLNYVEPTKKLAPYVADPSKPKALIVDLDGTLAIHVGRGPYEEERCGEDALSLPVFDIITKFAPTTTIIYCSGRHDTVRAQTQAWLDENECPTGPLFMRAGGDSRNDAIVKLEIFDRAIRDKYNVQFVLDDRDRVVKMWRDLGLTCLQVNYGNF